MPKRNWRSADHDALRSGRASEMPHALECMRRVSVIFSPATAVLSGNPGAILALCQATANGSTRKRCVGVMECWSHGKMAGLSHPSLHHSTILPCLRLRTAGPRADPSLHHSTILPCLRLRTAGPRADPSLHHSTILPCQEGGELCPAPISAFPWSVALPSRARIASRHGLADGAAGMGGRGKVLSPNCHSARVDE
jgi:hypothetical protein